MVTEEIRLSKYLLAKNDEESGEIVLKARDEVGRGKRYGMSGVIEMDEAEAEAFAKWVFVHDLAD